MGRRNGDRFEKKDGEESCEKKGGENGRKVEGRYSGINTGEMKKLLSEKEETQPQKAGGKGYYFDRNFSGGANKENGILRMQEFKVNLEHNRDKTNKYELRMEGEGKR